MSGFDSNITIAVVRLLLEVVVASMLACLSDTSTSCSILLASQGTFVLCYRIVVFDCEALVPPQ